MIIALQTELDDKYAQLLSITLTDEGQPPLEEFTGTLMRPLINSRKFISSLSQDYQPKENELLCLSTNQLVEGFNLLTSGQDRYDCIKNYVSLFPAQLGQIMGEIEEIKRQISDEKIKRPISEAKDKEIEERKGMMASEPKEIVSEISDDELDQKIRQILTESQYFMSIRYIGAALKRDFDIDLPIVYPHRKRYEDSLQRLKSEVIEHYCPDPVFKTEYKIKKNE